MPIDMNQNICRTAKGLLVSLFALLVFQACDKSESHQLNVLTGYEFCFADDTLKELRFTTQDSWLVETQSDWLSFPQEKSSASGKIVHDDNTLHSVAVPVYLTHNKSGKTRIAQVDVKSHDYAGAAWYIHYPIFHFLRPSFIYGLVPPAETFLLEMNHESSSACTDSIRFVVHSNWTLENRDLADWLTIQNASGDAGTHSATYSIAKNDGNIARQCRLVLTSSGIENVILVKQGITK